MNQDRKRLIEVSLPLRTISAQSGREKSIRYGHISTLHIWWARRPLAAIIASLMPPPGTDEEREEQEDLIVTMVVSIGPGQGWQLDQSAGGAAEGAGCLRRPAAAPEPEAQPEPALPVPGEPEAGTATAVPPRPVAPPPPPPAVYHRVTVETPVDWRQWYDFYQAVIKPLVESGAEVRVQLRLEAEGEIDANLVDLSVKESVVQLNPQGKVGVEGTD